MIKKIICAILATIVLASCCVGFAEEEREYSKDELQGIITWYENRMESAHQMATLARELGFDNNDLIIIQAKEIWERANNEIKPYQEQLDKIKQEEANARITVDPAKKAAYPYAAQVWEHLRNAGFNKYVTAGIIGNMMAECGGQTLKLQPFIYKKGFYGLCMWYVKYTPQVAGQSVQGQCNVLVNTIKRNFDMFGGNYYRFMNLQSEREAARQFEIYYGRGNVTSGNMVKRMNNASKALAYFQV